MTDPITITVWVDQGKVRTKFRISPIEVDENDKIGPHALGHLFSRRLEQARRDLRGILNPLDGVRLWDNSDGD